MVHFTVEFYDLNTHLQAQTQCATVVLGCLKFYVQYCIDRKSNDQVPSKKLFHLTNAQLFLRMKQSC